MSRQNTGLNRRRILRAGGIAAVASAFPMQWVSAADKKKPQKVLYFTRSAGFEHGAIKVKNGRPSISTKTLTQLGEKHGFEITHTKDGRVFDGDLDQYDCIAFYTSGDLTKEKQGEAPPMSPAGKEKLLKTIATGKGFVGFHSATDSFHCKGPRNENQQERDPYINMIGGEFIVHGAQQEALIKATDTAFKGAEKFRPGQKLMEEWYCLKNFADDLHVILIEDNEAMKGGCYQRPPFPATWARMHGKGRVFYTSFGHRDDIWTNEDVQAVILGGLAWTMGNVDVKVTPNIKQVTPKAWQLGS